MGKNNNKNKTTRVEDSGHRIPLDPAGKMRESHRILHENTRNCWNVEAVFRSIPANFLCFPAGTGRKSSEKTEKFPAGILLPQNHRNYPEPAVSGWD
jgi:hypothetical protein